MVTILPINLISGTIPMKNEFTAIEGTRCERENESNIEHTLEEAIEATRIGKFQRILIVLSGFSIMGATLENINFSYILPYAKCDMKLSIAEQGALASVSFLGIVSTSYFWGFLLDTWGRQKVLCVAAWLGFVCSFISSFSTNTIVFIGLRFLAGAFLSGAQAGAYTYVSEFHTSKTAGPAVAYAAIMLNFMGILLSLMAMLIIPMDWTWQLFTMDFKPWRLFLISISLLNLWNGIIFAFLPESPKFLLALNQPEEALQVLRKIYAFNTGQSEESYPVKRIKAVAIGGCLANAKRFCDIIKLLWSQTKPIFMPPLLSRTCKLCYIIFVIFACGHGAYMWFPNFLIQLQNYHGQPKILCAVAKPDGKTASFDEECASLDNKNILSYEILLAVSIFFLISSMVASSLLNKFPHKIIICIWLMISAITCVALNFLTEFNAIVFSFAVFLSCCSCAGIIMAVSVNLFPTEFRGMASAFILMFGRLGGFAGSNLVGILLAYMCTLIFYINAAFLVGCIFIFLTIKFVNIEDSKSDCKNGAINNTQISIEPM